jgi:hypothetical protein
MRFEKAAFEKICSIDSTWLRPKSHPYENDERTYPHW